MNAASIERVIASKDYYYAQGLGFRENFNTVILAKTKKEAERTGKLWQAKHSFKELYLYRNNYKVECRNMLSVGNYYGTIDTKL